MEKEKPGSAARLFFTLSSFIIRSSYKEASRLLVEVFRTKDRNRNLKLENN